MTASGWKPLAAREIDGCGAISKLSREKEIVK